jgi:hypothetical protein
MALCKTKKHPFKSHGKKESLMAGRAHKLKSNVCVRVHANKFSISIREHTPQKRGACTYAERTRSAARAEAL